MTPHPHKPLALAALVVLASFCFAQPTDLPTIQEFPITYADPTPCSSLSADSHDPHGHPGSTHEITFNQNDDAPSALWITGQLDDAVVRLGLDGTTTFYTLPACSGPHGIAFDGSGGLWVSLEFAGTIMQLLDADGNAVTGRKYDVRLRCDTCTDAINPHPHGMAFGPDGETLWFTGKATGTISKVAPDGTVETFSLPTVGSVPIYIRAGPDGNMWFTELVGNKIGRITPEGVVTEFAIPTRDSRPIEIIPEPDGEAMWFTQEAGNKVGRIDMNGTITEFPVPKMEDNAILAGLAFDDEGDLWVQQYTDVNHPHYVVGGSGPTGPTGRDYIVEIDRSLLSSGQIDVTRLGFTFYEVPSRGTVMHRIVLGPDGNLWFTELGTDKVGRLLLRETP